MLLTPTCQMGPGGRAAAVSDAVLAKCVRLADNESLLAWRANQSATSKGKVLALIKNKGPDRYYFLPSAFDLPDLLVDFSSLRGVALADLTTPSAEYLACLDDPFAASLLTHFIRYYGRYGTADFDADLLLERLLSPSPPHTPDAETE